MGAIREMVLDKNFLGGNYKKSRTSFLRFTNCRVKNVVTYVVTNIRRRVVWNLVANRIEGLWEVVNDRSITTSTLPRQN